MVAANSNLNSSNGPPSPSTSHPSSSQSSLGSLGRRSQPPPQPEGFSVLVTNLSGTQPISGYSGTFSTSSVKKSGQKQDKRDSTLLKPISDGGDDSTKDRGFRVFAQKPSMIRLSGGDHKGREKSRRVRLFVPKEGGSLAIYSEEDYLVQIVDLSLRSTDISRCDPSLFGLRDIVRIVSHHPSLGASPSSSLSSTHYRLSSRPPPSPSSPSFAAAGQGPGLGRTQSTSSHLVSSSPKSPRSSPGRPTTSSASFGTGASHHLHPGLQASPSSSTEPTVDLYLRFPNSESCRTWLALLQSFANPRHYLTPPQSAGNSPTWQAALETTYRVRTRISLRVCEARFSSSSSPTSPSNLYISSSSTTLAATDESSPLPATFVEIQSVPIQSGPASQGGRMLARSTVNRGEARPLWDQDFAFEDLEGREEVRLIVWKERKMGREGKVGECNVGGKGVGREGETMEGWYPLVHGSQYAGELKVRVTFTEQILFSRGYYRELEEALSDPIRTVFPFWKDCDQEVVARSLMRNALVNGTTEQLVLSLIEAEDLSSDTLMRSSTILTKCLEVFMKDHLSVFLSSALFKTINYVCTNKIALDIKMDRPEPGRSVRKDDVDYARKESERSERRKKRVAADGKTLMGLVEAVWGDIYAARGLVPDFVRNVFSVLFNSVGQDDKFKAVTSILFLRLLVPGMMYPSLFGLTSALPEPAVHHSLKLIAKSLSGLSFGGLLASKEPEMNALLDGFAKERHHQVTDFLYFVCQKEPAAIKEPSQETGNEAIVSFLSSQPRQDGRLCPPHFLDPAADLAALSTAISKSIDTMFTLGSLPANFESSPGFARQFPLVAIVGRIVDDEAKVRKLRQNQECSDLHRLPPFTTPPSSTSFSSIPSYTLSPTILIPPPLTKRPTPRDRSQTISSGSTSYDLPAPLLPFALGRRRTPSFNKGRRPSLPVSMQSHPATRREGGKGGGFDSESDEGEGEADEAERERLAFFATQRAELPRSFSGLSGGGQPAMVVQEEQTVGAQKKKFKWNAPFGGGGGKKGVV